MNRKSHQAEAPESWDIPPWELPGNFRLDALPHRGPLLRWLANTALLLALASHYPWAGLLLCCIVTPGPRLFVPAIGLGLLSASLGLATWTGARTELGSMRTGLVNRNGEWETQFARTRSVWSAILGGFSLLFWGNLCLLEMLGARFPF